MLLTACAGSPSRPSDPVPAPIPVPCQADLPHEPEPCSVRDNTRQEWLRCELVNCTTWRAYAVELRAALEACVK